MNELKAIRISPNECKACGRIIHPEIANDINGNLYCGSYANHIYNQEQNQDYE